MSNGFLSSPMPNWLQYVMLLAPGLLQGLTGGGQQPTPVTTPAQPERQFEGLAENIMSQMARAGKPRRTVTRTTATVPEEPLDWSNLMMLLMMIMQGQQGGRGAGAFGYPFGALQMGPLGGQPVGEVPGPMD